MSREWAPGDVADLHGARVVRHSRRKGYWTYPDGSSGPDPDGDARPLVVIDPEDREQVERFVSTYFAAWEKSPDAHRIAMPGEVMPLRSHIDAAQAALREFADPKPPCGASLTLGKDGALYRCAEAEGHDGPHADGSCIWTAVQPC